MEYTLSDELKDSIKFEIESKSQHNKKVIFGALAKEVFPDLKSTALLVGQKVELFSFE